MLIETGACAWVCWNMDRSYFVRYGDRFVARDGSEISAARLHGADGQQWFRTIHELGVVESVEDALAWLDARYVDCGYDMIHLADNEWGNELMQQIAMEHFSQHPDCQFVEVREHAGWFLCWRRDMSCWGTANDMARLRQPLPIPVRGMVRQVRRGVDG